jgi:hypothetical protein
MVCVSDPRLCWFMFRSDPRLPHYFGDLPLPLFLLWSHLLDHSDSDSGLVSSLHDFNLSRSSATLPIWSFQPTCSIGDSPLRIPIVYVSRLMYVRGGLRTGSVDFG